MKWSEVDLLEGSKAFVFENMPGIKTINIMLNNDTKADSFENSKQIRENAKAGKKTFIYF